MALIEGTPNPEPLTGTADPDILIGYGGADLLTGNGGSDIFRYTSVADSAYFTPDTITDYAAGDDKIDFAWLTGEKPAIFVYYVAGGTYIYSSNTPLNMGGGTDTTSSLFLSSSNFRGDDLISPSTIGLVIENRGGIGQLYGGSGDDLIRGEVSANLNEYFFASGGNDTVYAGSGDDEILGGEGADILGGEFGDDILEGGEGSDSLYGGPGRDSFRYMLETDSTISNPDRMFDFTTGSDQIDLSALSVLGSNPITVSSAGFYNIVYVDTDNDGTSEMALIATGPLNGGDIIQPFSSSGLNYIGSNVFDDAFTGTSSNDVIAGYGGNDILDGGDGADMMYGGAGTDTFRYSSAAQTDLAAYDLLLDFQSGSDKIDVSGLINTSVFISFFNGSTFIYLDEGIDNTADGVIVAFNQTVLYSDFIA